MNHRFYLNDAGEKLIEVSPRVTDKMMGLYVKQDGFGHFVEMNIDSLTSETPEICRFSRKISVKGVILCQYHSETRTPGIYCFGGSTATLLSGQQHDSGGTHSVCTNISQDLTCEGTSFSEVQYLIRRVMEGSILPREPHNKPQVKPLPIQFRDWIMMGWRLLMRDVFRRKGAC